MSEHEEWMSTVHGLGRELTILHGSTLILTPNGVNTILIEEVLVSAFSETEDALELIATGYIHLRSNPVLVGIEEHPAQCEVGGLVQAVV